MSTFPDCRNDDYYNEDFLVRKDSDFVQGFDWAAEAVDNLFNNLETMTDESDHLEKFLTEPIPEHMQEDYTMEFKFPEPKKEERKVKTYGDYIRYKILCWLESERNELITSAIDGMDENLYQAIRNKVLRDNQKKKNPKEYYNTRKYLCTGAKEGDGPTDDDEENS